MGNGYIEYYGKHHISPVNQNIKDIEMHYERRKKLYRQCGIPIITFKDKELLEVGPGGGVNTLAFFHWGIKHVDLVEPNHKGREDMCALFSQGGVPAGKYEIFQCAIENYSVNKKYDIIIAEGFLQHLPDNRKIINKLKELMADDGVIVITCTDGVCLFIEIMKRLLGQVMTKDIQGYEDKVSCLEKLFEPQLAKLQGVSRPAKDWVQDQILNPVLYDNALSMFDAINLFGEEYDVLGSSPNMFTDYSWYKDIWFNYKEDYKQQFREKRLSLLKANMPEKILLSQQVERIVEHFEDIRNLAKQYENTFDDQHLYDIGKRMHDMEDELKGVGNDFMEVFYEIEAIIDGLQKKRTVDMEQFPHFFNSFGRTQQYMAFVKNSKI